MTQSPVQRPAFDSWAAYYDITDADRTPFVAFYRRLVDHRTRRLLELGCGTGTVLVQLAEEVFRRHGVDARVAGVDESPEMLGVAASRDARVRWLVGDMRSPPVAESFDLVISCFNTLQFLLADEDLLETLRAVRRLLAPSGEFAFDIYQPNIPYISTPAANRLARVVTDDRGRRLEIRETTAYDGAARILTIDWRLMDASHGGPEPLAATRYRMRQYFADEIEALLGRAGLAIRARYGDFDRSQFTPESKKQVVVCEPAG